MRLNRPRGCSTGVVFPSGFNLKCQSKDDLTLSNHATQRFGVVHHTQLLPAVTLIYLRR